MANCKMPAMTLTGAVSFLFFLHPEGIQQHIPLLSILILEYFAYNGKILLNWYSFWVWAIASPCLASVEHLAVSFLFTLVHGTHRYTHRATNNIYTHQQTCACTIEPLSHQSEV